MKTVLWLSALALMQVAPALQDPEYKGWATCKPCSWVTCKDEARGMVIEMTSTLESVDAQQAILQVITTRTVAGKTMKDPKPFEHKVPAKPEEPQPKVVKEGDEQITVAGKKLKCRWRLLEVVREGQKRTVKLWLSDEIPGAIAQMEMIAPNGTLKRTVIAWEKK